MMAVKAADIIARIETWLPEKYAVKDDQIGLQLGSSQKKVERILVTLDVTREVVEEAKANQIDMIFCHHTPFYTREDLLRTDTELGKMVQVLLQQDIVLYTAHTNLDAAFGGVNDVLADMLGLQNVTSLITGWQERYIKFTVTVPAEYEEKVRSAITRAGAGYIGNYSDCTFHIPGTGYFMPKQGTEPFLGVVEELSRVSEVKIETIANVEKIDKIVKAMMEAHPYEEPAYDIIPLYNDGKKTGIGRVGYIQEPVTLNQFLATVSGVLGVPALPYVGNPEKHVYKIAVCGGSGMSFFRDALQKGADVYVTGDVKYHDAQDAKVLGLAVIDAGHYATEKPVVEKVANFLLMNFKEQLSVYTSKVNTNPFTVYKG